MQKPYALALHIFRRDLRLEDNTALIAALQSSKEVIPCFIFDPRQIERNEYKGDHSIQFMVHSLQELDAALQKKESRLYYFYGLAEDVVCQLLKTTPIQAVFVNRDYTPFSRKRDQKMATLCQEQRVDFHSYADALLQEPEQALKPNHEPYTIFTPFFKRAAQHTVTRPQKNSYHHYYRNPIPLTDHVLITKLAQRRNSNLLTLGGRQEALMQLKKIQRLTDYANSRQYPALDGSSHLSAHHKFGTISIRETYAATEQAFGKTHTLITELYWRDFFTHITFHYPYVLGQAFQKKFADIAWSRNETHFRAWCEGRTGFPIVDAGMRELNATGYMHNRVRMITASFLTKDLHIDWRWGEKYFAQKLCDYDPAVNNGNWQWAASTGCDAQPYFRIFNPWLQQQKFDPECLYIKRFIPELASFPAKTIHQLHNQPNRLLTNYPSPIINHADAIITTRNMYNA